MSRPRSLAVNALSGAITGQDLRRDAAGAPRPLEEIAADYHRLVADADGVPRAIDGRRG